MSLAPYNAKLAAGETLSAEDIYAAFAVLMDGGATLDETKDFLERTIPLMADASLIAGGAHAMRARMVRVKAPPNAIDVCGTGGDGAHTLNISTAVAFVVAGAGVPVAKHGNRAMSSKCGTADVLEALGVKLTGDPVTLEKCLSEAGLAFLFAQNHHPAMRHVAPARKELGKRTIFNLLGPLSNPAGVKRQLTGVFAKDFVAPMAEALQLLGSNSALVVHGAGGLDEFAALDGGVNYYASFTPGQNIVTHDMPAAAIASATYTIEDLKGGDAVNNAFALKALLAGTGENKAYRAAVVLNAAAALGVAGVTQNWAEAAARTEESLHTGAALRALDALVEITQAAPEAAT